MLSSLFNKSTPKNDMSENDLFEDDYFNDLRKREYSRLDKDHHVYLDYTGGNLYAESQLDAHHEMLKNNTFGNPHSTNPTSQLATIKVHEAREKVLEFFNAKDDYYCIFTQNASGALKIVGECYPFCEDSFYLLLADNHNSVNGIRAYCQGKKAGFAYAPLQYDTLQIDEDRLNELLETPVKKRKLFAYPAQSNVSGVKHDLGWIEKAKAKGWDVLLDAAAYVPTSKLDLKNVKPDFVSVSFYKIFGYPTGLGCLLVRKDKFDILQKPWFAGGTVSFVSVLESRHFLVQNHERFENGTINYLDIPAIKIGLDFIENIGIERINKRVAATSTYLFKKLKELKHSNGESIVKLFGPCERENVGGTLIMNFFDNEGHVYPFSVFENETNKNQISIRSGCFCNPGLDEINSKVDTAQIREAFTYMESQTDYSNVLERLSKMRGATRVSVGIATTKSDLDKFIAQVGLLKDRKVPFKID